MREMEAQQCALKEEEKKLIKSLQAIQSPTVLSPPVAVTISPESTGATAKQSATPLSTQQVTQSAPSSSQETHVTGDSQLASISSSETPPSTSTQSPSTPPSVSLYVCLHCFDQFISQNFEYQCSVCVSQLFCTSL